MKATMPETETYGNRDLFFLAERHYIFLLDVYHKGVDLFLDAYHTRFDFCWMYNYHKGFDFCWMYVIHVLIFARCISYKV